jgi:hypothetical protein
MKALVVFLTVVVLVVTLAGAAHASIVLWTTAMYADAASQYVRCTVTNVSAHAIAVSIDLLDGVGGSLATGEQTVPAHGTAFLALGGHSINVCKFTVPSAASVRAGVCLAVNSGVGCISEVDAR